MPDNLDRGEFSWSLLAGERAIWSGRPRRGLLLMRRDALLIPFSLMWTGFAIFWEAMAIEMPAPGIFRLWGVPFVLVGLYLTVGRFAADAWLRGRTYYAITNRRILIARSGPFGTLTAISLDRLPELQLSENAGGHGTIRFGHASPYQGFNGIVGLTPVLDPTPQFLAIENARSVFDQIQRASQTPR